jgi:hypothetical protein
MFSLPPDIFDKPRFQSNRFVLQNRVSLQCFATASQFFISPSAFFLSSVLSVSLWPIRFPRSVPSSRKSPGRFTRRAGFPTCRSGQFSNCQFVFGLPAPTELESSVNRQTGKSARHRLPAEKTSREGSEG